MNGSRKSYIISIIALLLGVVSITLGYAAFSNTLSISYSAVVKPDSSTFDVDFSTSDSSVVAGDIIPSLNKVATGFSATNGSINNNNAPTVSNLHANFTEPGQTVTYTFNSFNAGKYKAYLNSIVFSGNKSCSPKDGTNATLVAAACNGISFSVKVGDENATDTSVASISGHELDVNHAETVQVVISYDSNSAIADGDFDVTLPSVVLTYDSVD